MATKRSTTASSKLGTTVRYKCERCPATCEEPKGALLALLQLCSSCQEKRFTKGRAEQLKAERAEVARAG